MKLISKEDLGYVRRFSFVGKSFDSVVRLVSRFFQCFQYAYVRFISWFLFTLLGLFVFMIY